MTFKVHTTHRHVESFGHNNEHYEYDEPCDDFIDIEVDDEQVHDDVVSMIFDEYFQGGAEYCSIGYFIAYCRNVKERIKKLFDTLDVWDSAIDMYKDELREKYEEEYDRG